MIKLGGLIDLKPITEADVFTATSKETGTTSVFKSKAARDAAIEKGTHEKRKDDKDGAVKDPTDKPKVNIFDKPKKDKAAKGGDSSAGKSEPFDASKDEKDFGNALPDGFESEGGSTLPGVSAFVDDDGNGVYIGPGSAYDDKKPYAVSGYPEDDPSDTNYKSFDNKNDAIAYAKELGQKLQGGKEEEPKQDSGRPKDSTGGRAGNPEVNKAVRRKAKSLGVTAKQLGREEYERRMKKAAVEALTDSNFHSEARKLIAVLEDKPEWAKDPNQDPNKPDIFTPEYEKWQKTSVYSSDLYDSSPGTDEIGQFASQEAGYNGVEALDAIAFDLKMNGSKQLAAKLQSAIEDTNESSTKLGRLLPEQNRIHEGTRSQVGIIDRSGKIASGYVHYDGYPSNMKKGLKKHMKNEKDVLNLIKKGGARGIYNNKDIEYFNEKPSPLKGNFKDIQKYIKSADMRGGAEYVYLYNMKDKKWYFADTYTDKDLKKLF